MPMLILCALYLIFQMGNLQKIQTLDYSSRRQKVRNFIVWQSRNERKVGACY